MERFRQPSQDWGHPGGRGLRISLLPLKGIAVEPRRPNQDSKHIGPGGREWKLSSLGDSAGRRGKECVSLWLSASALIFLLSGVKRLRLVTSFLGNLSARLQETFPECGPGKSATAPELSKRD